MASSQMLMLVIMWAFVSNVSGQIMRMQKNAPRPYEAAENLTVTVYHMFEPKYTGLANKDGADYDGSISFIFLTFRSYEASNPESAIADNIYEMSTVNVAGWGDYEMCNAPGCTGKYSCPANSTEYCCTDKEGEVINANSSTLPGRLAAKDYGKLNKASNGFWYSFPKESAGETWTESKVQRRINSACLAEAWRADAGGCPDCQDLASQCTADCIKDALVNVTSGDDSKLKATWDRVFSDRSLCPDQLFPSSTIVV